MDETELAVGCALPPHTPHAISVSLPTWGDVVGYEEGEKRVMDSMVTGYPRFFIHLSIQKVSSAPVNTYGILHSFFLLFSWPLCVNTSMQLGLKDVCSSPPRG